MEIATLSALRREHKGTHHCRRLRQKGKLPAIIYGHGEKPEPVTVDLHDVELALLHHSRVVHLDLDGGKQQYLIKAVQYDYLGTSPIHLDLMRVDADERVTVKVEVELKGTPKGAHEGGHLLQIINEIEVECPVTAIPEVFRLSVVNLDIGDALTVADIVLPEGVTVLADRDDKIAVVRVPTEVEEATEEEAEGEAAAAAEPEVIGRAKEEEEDKGD